MKFPHHSRPRHYWRPSRETCSDRGLNWYRWQNDARQNDTEKLRLAWNARAVPLGDEMLRNGSFREPLVVMSHETRDSERME